MKEGSTCRAKTDLALHRSCGGASDGMQWQWHGRRRVHSTARAQQGSGRPSLPISASPNASPSCKRIFFVLEGLQGALACFHRLNCCRPLSILKWRAVIPQCTQVSSSTFSARNSNQQAARSEELVHLPPARLA